MEEKVSFKVGDRTVVYNTLGAKHMPEVLNMVEVGNHWVWIGEYYSDPYKHKGGIVDIKC